MPLELGSAVRLIQSILLAAAIEFLYHAGMPTLRQLAYLVALEDHLHFGRAAEHCHVTQPTLSAQLRDLETRLGAVLVDRTRTRITLTPTGQAIAERARRMLAEVEEIRVIARTDEALLTSTIRVGVVQSSGSYFLPLVVPPLHQDYPRLKLYIREGMPAQLLRSLEDGTLDLLFFPLPVRRPEFESLSLFREPLFVVASSEHRFAAERYVDPVNLKHEKVLALDAQHLLYGQVRRLCEDYGAELSHDYEGTSLDTLRQMVAMNMGISVMPALYIRSEVAPQDAVVARPFRGGPPHRTIGALWRRGTAREQEYLKLCQAICGILKEREPGITVLG